MWSAALSPARNTPRSCRTRGRLGARVSTDYQCPARGRLAGAYRPLRDTAEADATLDRALRAGVSDARVIVDDF